MHIYHDSNPTVNYQSAQSLNFSIQIKFKHEQCSAIIESRLTVEHANDLSVTPVHSSQTVQDMGLHSTCFVICNQLKATSELLSVTFICVIHLLINITINDNWESTNDNIFHLRDNMTANHHQMTTK